MYSAITGKIEFLGDAGLKAMLTRMRREHHGSVDYFIKKRIITDNPFGVDIMEEATDIAKLRLFLALVASAKTRDQLEPLPNLRHQAPHGPRRGKRGRVKVLEDCFGHKVRLTDERLAHILEHPEMSGMEAEIERVVRQPQFVQSSRSDAAVPALL